MEILLDNGTIVDGTGNPARPGSILVREGKVVEIGPADARWPASQTIDCSGLVVAPGFVDVHAHSDYEIIEGLSNKILQGVTTEVVGNCGYSLFPMKPDSKLEQLGSIYEHLPPMTMVTAAGYFSLVEAARPLVNVAALTGHSPLRNFVIGMDRRAPHEGEQKGMERLLEQSLEEGSIGFSTGLNLMPCSFAGFGELESLCRVLKRYGAYYTTHMRDYKFHAVEAVREAIRLAEASDAPVQLSHVQVVGKKCWHQLDTILEIVDAAAARGLDIGMDAYPYLAGDPARSCSFSRRRARMAACARSSAAWNRPHRANALRGRLKTPCRSTWADIVISGVKMPASRSLLGKSIEQIAAERGAPPCETAMNLLREQEGHLDVISSFNSREENLRKVLCHPLTSVCTDGFVAKGLSHPRTFGSYPEFLGKYVRDHGWMPLETAIVKTSAAPARRFRLSGRGTIAPRNWADLVVFDAAAIGTRSDYSSPAEPPEGIRMVLVNGEIVVENGRLTGARPGAVLRHARTGAWA